ncbi:MAG TPA: saccharopine dehydrogenase NADP-binding domain-containing protein, partial [Terricaulis sp.]|nr:saccharopine dehydrogenase NADP-binding domain-containing protein [Terricaulis sp.]
MKRVLIVGGAGVFGRRLAEGLRATTDAHLILAGRSHARAETARAACDAHEAAALDRARVDTKALRALKADLVIDAAGPFQGADLRFARAVIEAGAHYLDLADARDFVAAFPALNALARERGVAAITGASSTPALTHAVLDHLV